MLKPILLVAILLSGPAVAQQQFSPDATAYEACKDATALAELLKGQAKQVSDLQNELTALRAKTDTIDGKPKK